jgi:SAM-dependent methyltransferase
MFRTFYRGAHRIFAGLAIAECGVCGMAFADPMPSKDDLAAYNASYFTSAHGGIPTSVAAQAFFSGIARLRLACLEAYLESRHAPTVSTVMEFGPGPGFFATAWLERHPGTTYLASETDTSCHARLTKSGIKLVDDAYLTEAEGAVDLVVMSHVLEHVTAPLDFIREATRGLRKGGVLFIEVPCRDYLHKSIDEPHLLFFDKKPMGRLLEVSGFEDIELGYFGQEIDGLRMASVFRAKWMSLRSRLIDKGVIWPFSRNRDGMAILTDPMERAAVAPFKAHRETSAPAWWLRAMARKR